MSQGEAERRPEPSREDPEPSLLDQVCAATKQTEKSDAELLFRALVEEASRGTVSFDKNVIRTLNQTIQKIDELVSRQLSTIMHDPRFQRLEGSWRGLHYLVSNSETGEHLRLRVLNCSKRDLFKDLDNASEFDQSKVFKQIYEDEFGSPGGHPYGTLIGDYYFENHPEDIALLEKMAGVSSAAFAPFLTAPSHELFGFEESWKEMIRVRDLKGIFQGKEYTRWNSFRNSPDSRFVTMCMPRTLARLPYGAATNKVDDFGFEEVALGPQGEPIAVEHDEYCWMNTAYVLGTKLTAAFAETHWCTAIRGANSGGKVERLPTHVFRSDDGDVDVKCPTEIGITDRREKELSDLGFLSLCHYKDTDYSVFFGAQTCQKPKEYTNPAATDNAKISARLPYIMASSRIAHYLKVMARDNIGSFKEATDVEEWLNEWIAQYVSADEKPSEEQKARYPLREAKIQVAEIPGEPGSYNAVAHLRPWLQMEELNASVRMVARLPAKPA